MFSTKKAKDLVEVTSEGLKYITAGIHENVALKSAKTDISVNGNVFVEVRFEKDGQEAVHTEWEPSKKSEEGTMEFEARCTRQVKKLVKILENVGYDYEEVELNTFKEFADWYCVQVEKANKENLLRLKLVYTDKGYVDIPKYSKFTWIESMNISKDDSKMSQLSFDRFIKPEIKADADPLSTNPLSTPMQSTEELPF